MGNSLATNVFVGEFPTGEFNAQTAPANGGVFLLVNTGAIDFMWRIAKLQTLCMPPLGSTRLGPWPAKQSNDRQIVSMFAECILSYLKYRNVARASHIPVVGGFRSVALVNFVGDCERFLVGHELGHVVNRDLQFSMVMARDTPTGRMEFFRNDHARELAADAFAADLLLFLVTMDFPPKARDDKTMRFMKVTSSASAPQFFFALDIVLTDAVEQYFGTLPELAGFSSGLYA